MTARDLHANEKNFIGALLRSPNSFWSINDMVDGSMFSSAVYRDIFTSIRDIAERGRQVTMTALQAHLPEEYDEHGPTVAILATLRENAVDAGSPSDYAEFIAESSASKRIAALGQWMVKETGKRSAEDVAGEASLRLQEIMSVATPMRPKSLGDIASAVTKSASSAHSGQTISGLDTGIAPLDEIMGLMLAGDLGFIIASQSDGKSALASQIAMHVASLGRPVLFCQLEMSDEQMGARELAALSGISVSSINEGSFDAFQWESLVAAEKKLQEPKFHILDTEELTVRQLKAQAANMQRTGGLALIVVDQLDKIKPEGKHRDRFEKLAEITRDLKKMAKSLKVPVLVLAQRTRGAQRRDDPTPDILDADAPSIERDADFCVGLWRKENWLRRNKPDARAGQDGLSNWEAEMFRCKDLAEVICLKRRRGRAFQQRALHFDGPRMRFQEVK